MRVLATLVSILPNFLKQFVLRTFKHAKIGQGVRIGFGAVILADHIRLDDGTNIGAFTYIRVSELSMGVKAKIGSRSLISVHTVRMGPRSVIGGQVNIIGEHDENGILCMGMYSWIFQFCYVNVTRPVTLGKNVGVGGGTFIFTHGYWLSKLDGFPVGYGEVTIGDDTWLPWDCFVMPGVTIGSRVVVGARSLVTKNVPDGSLVAGVPAKVLRDQSSKLLSQSERIGIFDELIRDYAKQLPGQLLVEHRNSSSLYRLSGALAVNLCDDQNALEDDVFNVCWSKLEKACFYSKLVWSLCDYTSSPERSLPKQVVEFMEFGRSIGLRFYPVDELQ